jgi:hypothetical protein
MAEGQGNFTGSDPIFTATTRRAQAAQYFEVCSMPPNIQREVEIPGMWPYSVSGLCEGHQVQAFLIRVSLPLCSVPEADFILFRLLSKCGGSIILTKDYLDDSIAYFRYI